MSSIDELADFSEHDDGEGAVAEPGEGFSEVLIVSGESLEASSPREASFHDPASGQHTEAKRGFGMLDHL